MKGGAHPSSFAAIFYPNSNKITHLLLGWQREFSGRWMTKLGRDFMTSRQLSHHNQASLTIPLRHLSRINENIRFIKQFQGGHALWKTGKMVKKNSLQGKNQGI